MQSCFTSHSISGVVNVCTTHLGVNNDSLHLCFLTNSCMAIVVPMQVLCLGFFDEMCLSFSLILHAIRVHGGSVVVAWRARALMLRVMGLRSASTHCQPYSAGPAQVLSIGRENLGCCMVDHAKSCTHAASLNVNAPHADCIPLLSSFTCRVIVHKIV